MKYIIVTIKKIFHIILKIYISTTSKILVIIITIQMYNSRTSSDIYEYYEAGTWLHYIFPNLLHTPHVDKFFKELGITPDDLK